MLRIERIPGRGVGEHGRGTADGRRGTHGGAPGPHRPVGLNSKGTQNAQKRPLARATQNAAERRGPVPSRHEPE